MQILETNLTCDMIRIKDIPGVQTYQSKLSEHYFLGIQLEKTKESIVNVLKFLVPGLPDDVIETLRNSEMDDTESLELPMNNDKQKVTFGSCIMMNMFGAAVVVSPDMLEHMFNKVENEHSNDILFVRTFKCTITLNIFRFNTETMRLEMNNMFFDVIWETYKDYPSKSELIENVKNTDNAKTLEELEKLGYTITYDVLGIQELTINQRMDYTSQKTS